MTSQIFANVYLNEFDRFIRHTIKPLGYVRYGDDFVVFLPTKEVASGTNALASKWLLDTLKLQVHPKNTIVVKARLGLKFLGHQIYPSSDISVDRYMIAKITRATNRENAASYRAAHIPSKYLRRMPWIIKNNAGL